MEHDAYPLTLFYDGACPLCAREVAFLARRDRHGRLRPVDVSAADFTNDTGVPLADLLAAMHARRADGRLVTGPTVFRLAYEAIGLGWIVRPLGWAALAPMWDALYRFIARNRNRFPGWASALLFGHAGRRGGCGDGQCRL